MDQIDSKDALREQLGDWRHGGDHIALVPTMGNLHDGHLSLVRLAREHAERVVVSVFVNPTQFGAGEDFENYPRTMQLDVRRLKQAKADALFAPDIDAVYPFGVENATVVAVPVLTDQFCGSARPGHFDGVTSVVTRLFNMVQPDVAVFGQKDYQQQLIIRRLVTDLSLPIKIISGPTQREDDGLAMSSRNQYLTDAERTLAPELYRMLEDIAHRVENGDQHYADLEQGAVARLTELGFQPEYVSIRRAESLMEPDRDSDELVVMAAARLGKARLIDNILVHV